MSGRFAGSGLAPASCRRIIYYVCSVSGCWPSHERPLRGLRLAPASCRRITMPHIPSLHTPHLMRSAALSSLLYGTSGRTPYQVRSVGRWGGGYVGGGERRNIPSCEGRKPEPALSSAKPSGSCDWQEPITEQTQLPMLRRSIGFSLHCGGCLRNSGVCDSLIGCSHARDAIFYPSAAGFRCGGDS